MEAEEDKMVEHAKKAIETLTDKKKSRKEKIGDFLLEILIIIIAVNITIWFHNWSEQRHDRELEKNFLIGIRDDLSEVKRILDGNINDNQSLLDYYDSLWVQTNEHRIDKAFVDANSWKLSSENYFYYNNSRYENFKSSGYLRLIENDSLSQGITSLYSIFLPLIVDIEKRFFEDRNRANDTYIGTKVPYDSSGTMQLSDILNNPEVKYQINKQKNYIQSVLENKKNIRRMVEIIKNIIDRELKDRFHYEVSDNE